MIKKNKFMRILTLILTICFFIGCKSKLKLENKEAEDLITKTLGLPKKYSIKLENFTSAPFDLLQQNGLLTYKWKWEETYGDASNHSSFFDVTFTDKGKPFLIKKTVLENDLENYTFKTYDIDFGSIEGISINQEEKTATVRFTTYAINITPVAESLTKGDSKKYIKDHINGQSIFEIVFKKFDNGWQKTSEEVKKIGENDIMILIKTKTE